jgi:hypothetical protein
VIEAAVVQDLKVVFPYVTEAYDSNDMRSSKVKLVSYPTSTSPAEKCPKEWLIGGCHSGRMWIARFHSNQLADYLSVV